jgi:hypothetical protein
VAVEFVRGDGTVLRLESFEPVTDRHFREDNSMVCIASECADHWKADFPDAPEFLGSEYGDADGDAATNLEAWRAQTDPTEAASTPVA